MSEKPEAQKRGLNRLGTALAACAKIEQAMADLQDTQRVQVVQWFRLAYGEPFQCHATPLTPREPA